jgi:hypothetical protein
MATSELIWGLVHSLCAAAVAVACGWFAWELLFKDNRR